MRFSPLSGRPPFLTQTPLICLATLAIQGCIPASARSEDPPNMNVSETLQGRETTFQNFRADLLKKNGRRGLVINLRPSADDSLSIDKALKIARDARVKMHGPITLLFAPGKYTLARPIVLGASDSGSPNSPLRIEGGSGGPVIFTGASPIKQTRPPENLARLIPPSMAGRVKFYQVPASYVPVPPFPRRSSGGTPAGATLTIVQGQHVFARSVWPAIGYSEQIIETPLIGQHVSPIVKLTPPLLEQLKPEPSLYSAGYWSFDWFFEEQPIASINPGQSEMNIGKLSSTYSEAPSVRFKILNGFSFLKRSGDMAFSDGLLATVPFEGDEPLSAASIDQIVDITGAHDVAFDGISIEGARSTAFVISGSHDILFANGYIGRSGGSGVSVANSQRILIDRTVISDLGESGLTFSEDRQPVTGNTDSGISNSIIFRVGILTRAYMPAIRLNGSSLSVVGNKIYNLPHSAIIFNGQNHLIDANEIFNVDLETADSGAIYSFGQLNTRGTLISRNYFHDISMPSGLIPSEANQVRGVYLDSWTSGQIIFGNLFYKVSWPFWINGGEKNVVTENIFYDDFPNAGKVNDISKHWRDQLGARIRSSLSQRMVDVAPNLRNDSNSLLMSKGLGGDNIIKDNFTINTKPSVVDASMAPYQWMTPEQRRDSSSPSLIKQLSVLKSGTWQSDAPNRAMKLATLRYSNGADFAR